MAGIGKEVEEENKDDNQAHEEEQWQLLTYFILSRRNTMQTFHKLLEIFGRKKYNYEEFWLSEKTSKYNMLALVFLCSQLKISQIMIFFLCVHHNKNN